MIALPVTFMRIFPRAAVVAAALWLAAFAAPASAQANIAVLNMERAIFTTKAAEQRIEGLNRTASYRQRKKSVEDLRKRGQKLTKRFEKDQVTMGSEQREQLTRQIQDIRADLEHELNKMKELELEVLKKVRDEIGERAQRVVKQLIESEEIDLLLRESAQVPVILHVSSRYDLTAKVTERLNRLARQDDK